jgi:nucleoside-diphosphate-sugar epimerase
MRIVIIGGTGHIGSYLVPRLVHSGHEVIVVTRGQRQPYFSDPAWKETQQVILDRLEVEKEGRFGKEIRHLKPEAVMDLTCFTLDSARQLVEALQGEIQFFAHCGTIWVRGYSYEVPAKESDLRNPITDYGRRKNEIENYLLDLAHRLGFPACVLHPGHIVGPGWVPVGPTACHDLTAIERLLGSKEIVLPNLGMETLHHVHADDVAQAFIKALLGWRNSVGEAFFIVSPAAMTLRGFSEGLAQRFGSHPSIQYRPFDEWILTLPEEFRESGISHVKHSSNASIEKAARFLNYQPRYTSLDAVAESVGWLIKQNQLHFDGVESQA